MRDSSSLVSTLALKLQEELRPKEIVEESTYAFKSNAAYANSANKLITAPASIYIDSSNNGLIFNFVKPSVMAEIEDQSNWRARAMAVQQLEQAFEDLETYESVYPFLAVFLRFLTSLITDKNFKICEVSLSISLKLLEIPHVTYHCNLSALVNPCIVKLGDNKISIRMISFKILKRLMFKLRSSLMIPSLCQGLESQNWHIREEIVGLLITAMLLDVDFDYIELVEPLAKLLDDQKTKIRNLGVEALAVLQSKMDILPSLSGLLDSSALALVESRFSQKQIAKTLEDYVEYPKNITFAGTSTSQYISIRRDEPYSARIDHQTKQMSNSPISAPRPISSIKEIPLSSKSQNLLPRRISPFPHKSEADCSYLAHEDLLPMKLPHESFQRAMNTSENWEHQFQTINTLRRLTKHHPEVFFSRVTLHNVLMDVIRWADSLRSSLAKNSLILLEEMCRSLRKSMDNECSDLIKILLKKAIDTNVFISQQARVTLERLLESLSEQKVLPFLLVHAQNAKNPLIRAKLAFCFGRLFKKAKEGIGKMRDIEKVFQILAEYTVDAAAEVRTATKEALDLLVSCFKPQSELDILLIRSLTDSQFHKIQKCMERQSKSQSPVKSLSEAKLKTPAFKLRKPFSKLSMKQTTTDTFAEIHTKLQDSNWRTRYESISSLGTISDAHNSTQAERIVNSICTGLSDSHIKIQKETLNTLTRVIPGLNKKLNPYLYLISSALAKSSNASDKKTQEQSESSILALTDFCDPETLILTFKDLIKTTRSRARANFLKGMSKLVRHIGDEILPEIVEAICENLEHLRSEVRERSASLLREIYQEKQEKMMRNLPLNLIPSINKALNVT